MTYRILSNEFNTFDEVVKWAWDTYKIELLNDIKPYFELEKAACLELETLIKGDYDEQ